MNIAGITFWTLAIGAGLIMAQPAASMPFASPTIPDQSSFVIQVRDHGHHYGHRFDGRHWHGNDHYYDNDDDSGVLFKSFVTGTLFTDRSSSAYGDQATSCAARYRSYDVTDNTYQPSSGPRRQCR